MRRALLLVVGVVGCAPTFDEDLSRIEEPRVIAVIAEPPEATPSEEVTFRAVIAAPEDNPEGTPTWSYCETPPSPLDNTSVSQSCAQRPGIAEAVGFDVLLRIPEEACIHFGPEASPGGPAPLPADQSGGYYQPLRIDFAGGVDFAFQRLRCAQGAVPADVVREFEERYRPNQNPTFGQLLALHAGERRVLDDLPAGEVTLELRIPAEQAETYALIVDQRRVESQQETLVATWFSAGGSFAEHRTRLALSQGTWLARNTWSGRGSAWIVLRDDRGGAAVERFELSPR